MPRPRGRRRGGCGSTEVQQGQAAHTARHNKHPEGPTRLLPKGELRLLMQGVVSGALVKGAQARVPTEGAEQRGQHSRWSGVCRIRAPRQRTHCGSTHHHCNSSVLLCS